MQKIKKILPEQTYKLRLKVLKTCEDYQYKYDGDFNETTLHFGAFINEENVGIVSLMENENVNLKGKQIQLRGMAVLINMQGKGIGKVLIDCIKHEGIQRKATVIWCNARDYSVNFYKKQGFKIKGDKFFIKNVCDHYLMFFDLDQ